MIICTNDLSQSLWLQLGAAALSNKQFTNLKCKKQLFLDITKVPFLLFCPLCSLQCSTPPTPGCWIYKGIAIQNSDIYGPEAPRDSSHACCCGTCTKLLACVRKQEGYVETTLLISGFFCLPLQGYGYARGPQQPSVALQQDGTGRSQR